MKELGIYSPTHGKLAIKLDDEDYNKLVSQSVYIHRVGHYLYARVNPTKIHLHRVITNCPPDKQVDHINRDTLDNRRCNLRIVTLQENLRNQKRANNKTGYTGVSFNKLTSKYEAYIKTNYRRKHLGLFNTIQSALIARQEAEKKYWGVKYVQST